MSVMEKNVLWYWSQDAFEAERHLKAGAHVARVFGLEVTVSVKSGIRDDSKIGTGTRHSSARPHVIFSVRILVS